MLHASYVSYIFSARGRSVGLRSAFGRPRHLTKACRERTSGTQGSSQVNWYVLSSTDRHSGATDEEKKQEEVLFKEVCVIHDCQK